MISFSSFKTLVFATGLTSLSFVAHGQQSSTPEADSFGQCIERLQQEARDAGVSERTTVDILGQVKPLERILSYDRNQPEFVQTFTGYFSKRVTDWRINKGREKLQEHKEFLAELTKQYGVPAQYLIAFWGLETNFGSYKGKTPIIPALTTLACDQRRSVYFSGELVQALLLLEREELDHKQMVGSWAGAMGHTQFMPTAYMKYAKDGDGDGKIDLWNNELDALASAAHFLQNLGWKTGYRWGREVIIPEGFDYQLAGKSQPQPLSFWSQQNVTQVGGKPLGESDLKSALLVPAGHTGSAFMVYPNFDVILRWNNSEYYGIAVGHLADRINGKGTLSKPLPELPNYTLVEMQQFQEKLNQLGYDVGEADGILGPATRKGVRAFQVTVGLIADGYPSKETVEAVKNAPVEIDDAKNS
ncbi:lytic murein transglycosylase [Paraglaciecola arctica]|uniref:lytic murein transglycosylase n=1 Tax=Paraglaciecola arctica TaxID=1128911 RepID=UPI001C06E005|nr:lytic murein transglycosylase [Paraglaciecola arctica]MBU3003941.1 lytic murein transglycosylase [Paraglaciecola arctica]